jgi:hypothetical protein
MCSHLPKPPWPSVVSNESFSQDVHIISTPSHYAPCIPSRPRCQLDSGDDRILDLWGSGMLDSVPLHTDTTATFRKLLHLSSIGTRKYHRARDETVRVLWPQSSEHSLPVKSISIADRDTNTYWRPRP